MPFRIARHRRFKIIVCLLGMAQLVGCATTEQTPESVLDDNQVAEELAELFEDFPEEAEATETEKPPEAVSGTDEPVTQDIIEESIDEAIDPLDQIAAITPKPVLPTPHEIANIRIFDWRVIGGASIGNYFTGRVQHRFKRPVAIAVQSEYLYVVDAGADALFRFDLVSERIETVLDLRAEVKGEVADLFVNKDFSFYLTDTEAGRVLHYDRHGRLIQVYRNHFNMVRPVAVTALDSGDVVVADAHYDHLLHFNSMGKLIATYGGRGQGVAEFLNIMTMAKGPDGYYVGGRVGRRIQVIGDRGNYLYAFEEGAVVFPASIVVDRENRSYVADYMDNTIKVFDRGGLIGTIGSFGTGDGQFKRITDLWLEGHLLYIVDSLNGRIQVAKLAPDPITLPKPGFENKTELFQESVDDVVEELSQSQEEESLDEMTTELVKDGPGQMVTDESTDVNASEAIQPSMDESVEALSEGTSDSGP